MGSTRPRAQNPAKEFLRKSTVRTASYKNGLKPILPNPESIPKIWEARPGPKGLLKPLTVLGTAP